MDFFIPRHVNILCLLSILPIFTCVQPQTQGMTTFDIGVADTWLPSPYTDLQRLIANNEVIIAQQDNVTSSWHWNDQGFDRKYKCSLPKISGLVVFPNTDTIIYSTSDKTYTLYVYDLSQCQQIFKKAFGAIIGTVITKSNGLLLNLDNSDSLLFNWDGQSLQPAISFNSTIEPVMSSNGVVVYRKPTDHGVLSVFNSTSNANFTIDVGFEAAGALISPDGSYLVAVDETYVQTVYDLIANRQIYIGGFEPNSKLYKILSDDRYVYLILEIISYKTTLDTALTVAYLDKKAGDKILGRSALTMTHIPITASSVFFGQFIMRKFNGSSYLQVISGEGVLSFYELTSDGKNWMRLQ